MNAAQGRRWGRSGRRKRIFHAGAACWRCFGPYNPRAVILVASLTATEWIAIAAVIVPALLLVFGIRFNRVLEIEREDRQRSEDRRRREIEAQRTVAAGLQDALAELQVFTGIAVLITNYPERANPKGDKFDVEAPWFLSWLKAEQRVFVESSRLGNKDLKEYARDFVYYKNSIQSKIVVTDPADPEELRALFDEMAEKVAMAQELAGEVYQDFGPPQLGVDRRPLWKRIVIG